MVKEIVLHLTEDEYKTINNYINVSKVHLCLEDFIFECVEEKINANKNINLQNENKITEKINNLEDEIKAMKLILFNLSQTANPYKKK